MWITGSDPNPYLHHIFAIRTKGILINAKNKSASLICSLLSRMLFVLPYRFDSVIQIGICPGATTPTHFRPFASEENTIIKLFDNLLNSNKFQSENPPSQAEERLLKFIKQIDNNLMIYPFSEKFLVGCALASPQNLCRRPKAQAIGQKWVGWEL